MKVIIRLEWDVCISESELHDRAPHSANRLSTEDGVCIRGALATSGRAHPERGAAVEFVHHRSIELLPERGGQVKLKMRALCEA